MWFDEFYFEALKSFVLAAILGGIIGMERAGKNHDAGLRTHILVSMGSATVMVLSRYIQYYYGTTDISRMGAQVISGIGFLGVGSIITNGDRIKGLTTAAGLWTTACVGLVVGMGYFHIAVTVGVLMIIVIWGLRPVAQKLQYKSREEITVSITVKNNEAFNELFDVLADAGIDTLAVKLNENGINEGKTAVFEFRFGKSVHKNDLTARLSAVEGITNIGFM